MSFHLIFCCTRRFIGPRNEPISKLGGSVPLLSHMTSFDQIDLHTSNCCHRFNIPHIHTFHFFAILQSNPNV